MVMVEGTVFRRTVVTVKDQPFPKSRHSCCCSQKSTVRSQLLLCSYSNKNSHTKSHWMRSRSSANARLTKSSFRASFLGAGSIFCTYPPHSLGVLFSARRKPGLAAAWRIGSIHSSTTDGLQVAWQKIMNTRPFRWLSFAQHPLPSYQALVPRFLKANSPSIWSYTPPTPSWSKSDVRYRGVLTRKQKLSSTAGTFYEKPS